MDKSTKLYLFACLCFLVVLQTKAQSMINQPYSDQMSSISVQPQQQQQQYPANYQYAQSPSVFSSGPSRDPRYDQRVSELISRNILQFAHNIGVRIESQTRAQSQIFSPICLASALSLLLLGSKGQTYQELAKLFAFDQDALLMSQPYKVHEEFGILVEDLLASNANPSRPRYQTPWKFTHREDVRSQHSLDRPHQPSDHIINIANGVFVQNGYSLRPDFITAVQSIYRSEITPLDFRTNGIMSRNYINAWVNQKTLGKIPTIISDEIHPDTSVIIASALYFKAFWENTFLGSATMLNDFYPDGRSSLPIKVNMMANGGVFPFYEAREYGCKIIGFPYKGNLTTMYVIMPYDSTRERLKQMQAYLTADKIEDMISKMTKKTAVLAFPKLHITNSLNMKKILVDMGVTSLFINGRSDLSLISDGLQTGYVSPVQNFQQSPPVFSGKFHMSNNMAGNDPLIFSRFGEEVDEKMKNGTVKLETNSTSLNETESRPKRMVTYKVDSEIRRNSQPLRLKDLILNKRVTKLNPGKKFMRSRRQVLSYDPSASLKNLDVLRNTQGLNYPQLFVEDIVHKVDLVVNEQGTEGAAATVSYLRRSGTDVVFRADTPFLILIRHDATKLPLFYGTVYEPTDF